MNGWRSKAACKGLTSTMFNTKYVEERRKALTICSTCPVKAECKNEGQLERFGVWGGVVKK